MRASSLSYNTIAVNREIDSAYDAVLEVRDNLTNIATVAGLNIDTILADLQDAKDFTGITVVVGEVASWDSSTKTITVPVVKGDTGDKGENGVDGVQGPVGETGPRGIQGIQGSKGDTGSVGIQGPEGPAGPKGDIGEDLTIEQIVYNGNGTFTWNFSDETVYTTPNMVGPQGLQGSKGDKGATGISVHHTKGTSTTDSEGDFGTSGEVDTYTMYGDADETINLGYFKVKNGADAYTYATAGGYIGTYEEFTAMLTDFGNVKDKAQEAYTSATEAAGSALAASTASNTSTTKATESAASAVLANTSAGSANTSAASASSNATIATTKASEASVSASASEAYKNSSLTYRDESLSYRNTSLTYKTASELAYNNTYNLVTNLVIPTSATYTYNEADARFISETENFLNFKIGE